MVSHYIRSKPGWVLPGAFMDLDFANERYYNAGAPIGAGATSIKDTQGSVVMSEASGIAHWSPVIDPPGGNGRVLKAHAIYELGVTRGYGLWSDGIRYNSCLYSCDLTQTQWTKTNCTAALTIGADGVANSGTKITATGANATCLQTTAVPARATYRTFATIATAGTGYTAGDTITLVGGTASTAITFKVATVSGGVPQTLTCTQSLAGVNTGVYTALPTNPCATTGGTGAGLTVNVTFNTTMSAYVKRVTGSGTVFMSYDGSTYTDITSKLNTTSYTLVSLPTSTTFAGGTPGFKITTSTDAIAIQHVQVENVPFVTRPQQTTTTAFVGFTDEPAFADPGGTRPGRGYAEVIRALMADGKCWSIIVAGSGNATIATTMLSDGAITLGGGYSGTAGTFSTGTSPVTATTGNTGTAGQPNINIIAGRVTDGGHVAVCLNGGAIVTGSGAIATIPQSSGQTHIGINNNGAGQNSIEGYTKRITLYDRPLTDGEMLFYTGGGRQYGQNI